MKSDDSAYLPTISLIAFDSLTLLHSERPKLYAILAFLSAIGLRLTSY